jgi:arsenate reductase (thioredoxin)
MDHTKKKRILFLCTGNSCRSQMAEALTNHFLGKQWTAFSAGTRPAGYVHHLATRALAEVGVHHEGESKSIDRFKGQPFDVVMTLCDDAAENCPVWLGQGQRVHIGFADPALASGSDSERLEVYRRTCDDIRRQVLGYLREFKA